MTRDPALAGSYPEYMTMDAEADAERVAAGEPEDGPQSEAYRRTVADQVAELTQSMEFIRLWYPEKFHMMRAGGYGPVVQAAALAVAKEETT